MIPAPWKNALRFSPSNPATGDRNGGIILALLVGALAALFVFGIALFIVEIVELFLYFGPSEHWFSP